MLTGEDPDNACIPAGSVEEEAAPVALKLQAIASKQNDQARALSELTFLVQQLLQTRTTEGQASRALPTESGGSRKGTTDPTSGFVDGERVRGNVEEASSYSEDAQSQQLPKKAGLVRDQPQDTGMARRLRPGGQSQEVLVARGAGFAPDGLRGLKPNLPKVVANASFLEWSRDITQYAHMHSSVRGLIGETSLPVGDFTLTSADTFV